MRPSSRRRSSGRLSDSPQKDTATNTTLHPTVSAVYNPSLPSYAQPTIAHAQRATTPNGRGSLRVLTSSLATLRAGTAKGHSRPSSRRLHEPDKDKIKITTPLKKTPSFVNIFRSDELEKYDPKSGGKSPLEIVWKKSPSYKSPKLIQPVQNQDRDGVKCFLRSKVEDTPSAVSSLDDGKIKKMKKEMETVLDDLLQFSEAKLNAAYSPLQLYGLMEDRKIITKDDWDRFFDYHLDLCNRFNTKVEQDYDLIRKLMEFNQVLVRRCLNLKSLLCAYEQQLDNIKNQDMCPWDDPESGVLSSAVAVKSLSPEQKSGTTAATMDSTSAQLIETSTHLKEQQSLAYKKVFGAIDDEAFFNSP